MNPVLQQYEAVVAAHVDPYNTLSIYVKCQQIWSSYRLYFCLIRSIFFFKLFMSNFLLTC